MEEHKSEIEIINRVLWLLTKSKGVADRYDAKIQLLAERKVRAMENVYRMGVIGVTSSGKSTLIGIANILRPMAPFCIAQNLTTRTHLLLNSILSSMARCTRLLKMSSTNNVTSIALS